MVLLLIMAPFDIPRNAICSFRALFDLFLLSRSRYTSGILRFTSGIFKCICDNQVFTCETPDWHLFYLWTLLVNIDLDVLLSNISGHLALTSQYLRTKTKTKTKTKTIPHSSTPYKCLQTHTSTPFTNPKKGNINNIVERCQKLYETI